MKKVIENLQNESNVLSFIDRIVYGSNYFISKNDESLLFLDNCVKILNASVGSNAVRVVEEKAIDMLEFYGYSIGDGLHNIICTLDKKDLPDLSEDSYNMLSFMNDAFNNKRMSRLDLDPSLFSYAKKLAKKDVMFDVDVDSPFFIGTKKNTPVYDQIKQAFYRGDNSIKFDINEVSVSTVRCYTSTLSKMSGNKFRCNIIEGFVTVQFKPITDIEDARMRISFILNSFKTKKESKAVLISLIDRFNDEDEVISDSDTEKIDARMAQYIKSSQSVGVPKTNDDLNTGYKLYGKYVSKDEYSAAEIWQRQGYASEYNMEHGIEGKEDKTPVVSDSINEYENENESFEDEDDDF